MYVYITLMSIKSCMQCKKISKHEQFNCGINSHTWNWIMRTKFWKPLLTKKISRSRLNPITWEFYSTKELKLHHKKLYLCAFKDCNFKTNRFFFFLFTCTAWRWKILWKEECASKKVSKNLQLQCGKGKCATPQISQFWVISQ